MRSFALYTRGFDIFTYMLIDLMLVLSMSPQWDLETWLYFPWFPIRFFVFILLGGCADVQTQQYKWSLLCHVWLQFLSQAHLGPCPDNRLHSCLVFYCNKTNHGLVFECMNTTFFLHNDLHLLGCRWLTFKPLKFD